MRKFEYNNSSTISERWMERNREELYHGNLVEQIAVEHNEMERFQQFRILDLLSGQQSLRRNAERIREKNMGNSKQYVSFLGQVVVASLQPCEVQLAFSLLRELIMRGNLNLPALISMLQFYSGLYLKSSPGAVFMPSFRLMLRALFEEIDSLDGNMRVATCSKPVTLQYYQWMESKVNEGCLLALSFMCLYIEHLADSHIYLIYFRKMMLKKSLRKLGKIQCGDSDPGQRRKFVELRGRFTLTLLNMFESFRTKVFFDYIIVIPKQVCAYTTGLLERDRLNGLQINAVICYLFSHVLRRERGGEIDGDLLIAISECCCILVERYFEKEHPTFQPVACRRAEKEFGKQTIGVEFDSQNEEEQAAAVGPWSYVSLQPEHYSVLLTWTLNSLVEFESPPEGVILAVIKGLEPIFTSKYRQQSVEDYMADQLFQLLLQRDKHGQMRHCEKYAYFGYYVLGEYFPRQYYQVRRRLAEQAILSLSSNRFKGVYDSVSLLMYLHKFVLNVPEYDWGFIGRIRQEVLARMQSFSINEISLAFLICLDRRHNSDESEEMNDGRQDEFRQKLWPSLAVCGPQTKVAILESLCSHFEREKKVSGCFLQELLCMINQNEQVFLHCYIPESLAVRIEYMRLVASCVGCVESVGEILGGLLEFLGRVDGLRLVQELEVRGLLNLCSNLIKQCHLSDSYCFSVEMIGFCAGTVNKYPSYVLADNRLLFQLLSISSEDRGESAISEECSTSESNEQQQGLSNSIIGLHNRIVELILSLPSFPTDALCDALQIYIMHNATTAKLWEDNILRACDGNYNYYRMAYLLRPVPYPMRAFEKLPEDLHHLKWYALYLTGKFIMPSFRLSGWRKQQEMLAEQFSKLVCGVGEQDREKLFRVRKVLQIYQHESSSSWISNLQNSSLFDKLTLLYRQRYSIGSILHSIDQLLQSD